MASSPARLLLLLLLRLLLVRCASAEDTPARPEFLMARLLTAVEDALDYLHLHIGSVNLDGLIGTRAVEGELGNMLALYWTRLPPPIVRRLRIIQSKAASVTAGGISVVRNSTPIYYSALKPILEPHFWDISLDVRPLRADLRRSFTGRTRTSFTEKESDDCLQELFARNGHPGCNVSVRCWRKMTHPHYAYYSLTHQVFYLLNAIQANCFEVIRALARRWNGVNSERDIMDQACADIFQQAVDLESKGPSPLMRDLFMEQIAICGKAGYLSIARWQWLPLILSWQRHSGCYGTFGSELRLMRYLSDYGTERKRSISQTREKRVEKVMTKDGCLSHRTSVAIFSLTTYIRRLLPFVSSSEGPGRYA